MGKAGTTVAKKTAAAKRKPAAAKKKAAGPAAAKTTKKAAPAASKAKKKAAAAPKKAAATRKKALAKAVAPAKAKKAAPKKPPAKGRKGGAAAGPATGKRGLKGQAAPDVSSGRVGKVDPAAGLSNEAVLAEEERDVELDAMLSQIDIKNNVDKYFVLQVICEPASASASKKKAKTAKACTSATGEQFYFFTRWGRTGTSGQGKLEGPHDTVEEASALFAAKFEEKTGNEWEVDDHEDRYVVNKGKYACLRPKTSQVQAETWQYWVDDKVDGKADGWYDYDDSGAMVVEQLFSEFQTNPTMSQRVVTSGMFTYLVDLAQMTQTNVGHPNRKMRHIRRNPGKSLPNTPPGVSIGGGKGKGKVTPSVAAKTAPASTSAEVDKCCPKAGNKGVSVCAGHDAKMNQTNIASNNNKFYILQMCRDDGRHNYFVWCRWGRVGELGAMAELGPFADEDDAKTAFAKKFRDKTGNKWADAEGGNFTAVPGKYELIETDSSDTTAAAAMVASGGGPSSPARPAKVLPSALDADTKELVELIFSEDMFKSAMSTMNIDVKKMPLGQLSNAQVQRGYAVLEELEDALTSSGRNRPALLETLSAKFYQVIPHAFGRQRPPVINTDDMLRAKVEMLNVLQDIGEAQTLLSSTDNTKKGKGKGKGASAAKVPTVPHPTDVNYEALNADLKLLSPSSHEYKTIKTYMENTKPGYGNMEMYNVWSVDRQGEGQRFKAHDKVANRKLLWHGTNVAVVAAIVKSGLRIMPHSGGRVGKGIYLASENAKSRQYVRPAYGAKGAGVNLGIMFLCEAALGKEASITVDDWKLTEPPPGYDSIVARGAQEPDPAKNVVIKIDGKSVSVPQGKPQPQPAYKGSRFSNSEYLVYKESQQRIRYMLTVKC